MSTCVCKRSQKSRRKIETGSAYATVVEEIEWRRSDACSAREDSRRLTGKVSQTKRVRKEQINASAGCKCNCKRRGVPGPWQGA